MPKTKSSVLRMISFGKLLATALCLAGLLLAGCHKKQHAGQDIGVDNGAIGDTLRVMEYNVENLFDMVNNGTEYREFKPNTSNWTNATYAVKLNNIASVIAAAHPNIAVLLEVENENSLKDLLHALKEKGFAYPYFAIEKKDKIRATAAAVISCIPLQQPKASASLDFLETKALWKNDTLTIFACHWPSKKYPESKRIVPALVLRKRLATLPSSADYIIAGDMNENYDECTSFGTVGLDNTNGKTALNHILGTTSEKSGIYVDYVTKKSIRNSVGVAHYDPWLELAENKRMSETFRRQYQTPDHILLPASLFDSAGISYIDRSFRVFTWNKRLLYYGQPYRWQMRFENHQKFHKGEGYSDHLPILIELCRKPFSEQAQKNLTGKSGANRDGFESSSEGWIAGETKIHISRDTVNPAAGHFCLKIAGQAGKQNGCAARVLLHSKSITVSTCRLRIKGTGEFSFRMSPKGSKTWTYYAGPDFKAAKAGKYNTNIINSWTLINLPVTTESTQMHDYELEIRIKKDAGLCIWLDTVQLL